MFYLISFLLAALAGCFYLAHEGQVAMFNGLCNMSPMLCTHPQWLLYAAGGFVAAGLVFNLDRI